MYRRGNAWELGVLRCHAGVSWGHTEAQLDWCCRRWEPCSDKTAGQQPAEGRTVELSQGRISAGQRPNAGAVGTGISHKIHNPAGYLRNPSPTLPNLGPSSPRGTLGEEGSKIMASVETIMRKGVVAYRGVPWDAVNRKKGPTRSFATESAAMAYARGWETKEDAVAEGFGVAPTRNRKRVLFSEYAMQYAVRTNGTPNTRRDRISHATQTRTRFAKLHLDEIDRGLLNDYIFELYEAGLAPGTVRKRLTFLRRVMAEALLDKLIDEDPCRTIESPQRVTLRAHRPPTEDEIAILIKAMPDWFEPAILLANDSGLRAAEVSGLRWARINWEKKTVLVKDVMEKDGTLRNYPKGKKSRELPLSPRTIAALRRAKLRQPGGGDLDHVVQRPTGKAITPHQLAGLWYRQAKRVPGIADPRPTFHDLRHGCAHRLVAAGVSMSVLQKFMGHASLATTESYMPLVSVDQLAAALAAVPTPTPAPVVAIAGA